MSLVGAIGGGLAGDKLSKGFKAAGDQVAKIYNESDLNTVYAPQGAAAANIQSGLLGIGDPAAAQGAFDNYLASSGYRTALQGGNDAITSSMAATYGLKGGAADKARLRFGTGLANQYFDNYFNQLNGVANRGMSADSQVTGATADARFKQYVGKGEAKAQGINDIFSGLGDFAGLAKGNLDAIWGGG